MQPMNRLLHSLRLPAIAIAGAALLGVSAAPAAATSEIEGVWSFNGGEVDIRPVAGGKFAGVVATPTKFSECTHRAGEEMWTGMTPQSDGSYWGFHQWLFEKTCEPNPSLGPTAWRVLHKPDGSDDLLVCFSEPGGTQPTIAPSGTFANVSRSCEESAPTAPLPVVSGSASGKTTASGAEQISFGTTIVLPAASGCVRQGSLRIKIDDPKYDPLKKVVVKLGKRKVAEISGVQRLMRGSIVLRGLPRGSYTLKITATTVLNQKLSSKRTYRSCVKRKSKVRLHRRRHH
jgi:hypothetical protein